MSWVRRLWYAAAVVGVLGAVAVFLGAVYGDAGITVESVDAAGDTPTNTSANCEDVVVRTVDVTVTLSRSGLRPENPQWWEVGVRVRASVFESAKQRTVSIAPGGERTVTIPFTEVQDRRSAPPQRVPVVVQVTKGQAELLRRSVTVTFRAVEPGRNC